jgi:hypothetical protein
MLSSAIWAPSHKLTEPWHFVVLEGQSKQDFIALTRRLVEKNAPPAKVEAQLAKLDRKAAADWTKVRISARGYARVGTPAGKLFTWTQGTARCTLNFLVCDRAAMCTGQVHQGFLALRVPAKRLAQPVGVGPGGK